MEELFDKLGYIKGLADGLGYDNNSPEGKMFQAINSLLEEMAQQISIANDRMDYMEDYMEEVDSDLCDLEQEIYEDEEEDDDGLVEIVCPNCGQVTYLDIEEDDLVFECPNCGETVNAVEILDELYGEDACCCGDDCCCEDDDCGCGCGCDCEDK